VLGVAVNKRIIYLASPYSHPDRVVRKWRYRMACHGTARLLEAGHLVYSPIVHSHPLTAYGLPANWEYWRAMDEAMLRRCDALVVLKLPDWEQSQGVAAEIALARELGLRIDFVAPKWEEVNDGNQQPEQGEAWRA
jgi:hypothetical protein